MIYLDNAATSLNKPPEVYRAVREAMQHGANAGRGGHTGASYAERVLYECREEAAALFEAAGPEQIVFTLNATHALNIAIKSAVQPGYKVIISGYEHNAVRRPLLDMRRQGVIIEVVRSALFEPEEFLFKLELALKRGADAAVLTHASNVFGYILPIERADALCARYNVPLIIDASQTAGTVPLKLSGLRATKFVCMPGHKGLMGPQGTGILICAGGYGEPLLFGGTGADSAAEGMPDYLPERLEAGTQNLHGIAGLREGIRFIRRIGTERILEHERALVEAAAKALGGTVHIKPYKAEHLFCQNGVLSVSLDNMPTETAAERLSEKGVAVRAGQHCAPLAHETAGTEKNGTLRMSMSWFNTQPETERAALLLRSIVTGDK